VKKKKKKKKFLQKKKEKAPNAPTPMKEIESTRECKMSG
jgi:hypothetical protein